MSDGTPRAELQMRHLRQAVQVERCAGRTQVLPYMHAALREDVVKRLHQLPAPLALQAAGEHVPAGAAAVR